MKISKQDIGGEVISILTRGMYPEPKDALREYIQNGVDARADNIQVKIKQDSIIISDNGKGMDEPTLRKAIRVGISDKNPNKDVGFMGIGIYSSFHLCDQLHIFSKSKDNKPYLLLLDFQAMRSILDNQREMRLKKKLDENAMIDLQTLLGDNIRLEEIKETDFPNEGTQVEMIGLDPIFFKTLSEFKEVSEYLKEVVPLHFDKDKFKWSTLIENEITKISKVHGATFELIDLELQVGDKKEKLYRPYTDSEFGNDNPLEPHFETIKKGKTFLGVVWGCLNSERKIISKEELRGFLLKKQGFAIGRRQYLVKYFGGNKFFDRYIGEVIILNNDLLPNAARSDLQYSILRTDFYESLTGAAEKFNDIANEFQEFNKGDEVIEKAAGELKEINANFHQYSENTEELLNNMVSVRRIREKIESRLKRNVVRPEKKKNAKEILELCSDIEKSIKYRINHLSSTTSSKYSKVETNKPISISNKLKDIPSRSDKDEYNSLLEVFEDLAIPLSEEIKNALEILDEKFIHRYAKSDEDHKHLLSEFKKEVEDTE